MTKPSHPFFYGETNPFPILLSCASPGFDSNEPGDCLSCNVKSGFFESVAKAIACILSLCQVPFP